MNRTTRSLTTAAAAAALLSLGGCLIGAKSSVDTYGTRVGAETLETIEVGTTTENWILATLGEPDAEVSVADRPGEKVIRYDYTVEEDSGGYVFLLFAAGSEKRHTTRTFFEIKDGVVTKFWTDGRA